MSISSISKFLYGTGLIGILLGIPKLEALPDIFYKHYLLLPTISFMLALVGGLDLISKFKKRDKNSTILLPKKLIDDEESKFMKATRIRRTFLIVFLIAIYFVVIGICYFEYDFKQVEDVTPNIPNLF